MINPKIIVTVLFIIIGAAGFFGGMKYQQSKQPLFRQRISQGQFQGSQDNRQGFRPVQGEIISSDEKSITVKMPNGSSKIVLMSDKTTINKAGEAAKEDLKTGEQVAVFGTENSNGTVTAQNIQLNRIKINY